MKTAKIFIVLTFLLAFAICVSAQDVFIPGIFPSGEFPKSEKVNAVKLGDVSPNELEGYKFFREGRLNQLKLGVSTKEDVENIFGAAKTTNYTSAYYDYDSDWSIQFVYFDDQIITRGRSINGISMKLVPSSEYIGKLDYIRITPKKTVSFSQIVFSDKFDKQSIPHGGKEESIEYYSYKDIYGLEYKIFNKITSSNSEKKTARSNGDLIAIEYRIPFSLEDKILVEQK